MSDLSPADSLSRRQLCTLGERLMAQPSLDAQREIIVSTVAELVGGAVDLWLGGLLARMPGGDPLSASPIPLSPLVQRALDTRQVACEPEDAPAVFAAALPLLAEDRVLGVLSVRRDRRSPLDEACVELLREVTTQSSLALHATLQVAVERWRVGQLGLVRKVSAEVASVLDLDELTRRVTRLILQTFRYYYVALFTLKPGQQFLQMRASVRRGDAALLDGVPNPAEWRVEVGQGIIGAVAQRGVEIVANDVSRESRYRYVNALPETRAEAAFPLNIGKQVVGVLDIQSKQVNSFDDTDLLVLHALADNIAIAVEHARLYGDLRHRADQLSTIAEVGRAVTSLLDLDSLFNEVVNLIYEQFGYSCVHLFTVDAGRRQVVYRAGVGPLDALLRQERRSCSLDDAEGIVPWVARSGETVLANDVLQEPLYRVMVPAAEIKAELAVPLLFGSGVVGVLDMQSEQPDAFSAQDRFLFEALADSVAIAIRNANLYRSERWRRQAADSMQQVAGLLSAEVALEQVLDAILRELERLLPCEVAAIWLLKEGDLCISAVRGYAPEVCISDFSPLAGPWLSEAQEADAPLVRPSQAAPEPLAAAMGFPLHHSAIAAPLRAGDRLLGLLTLSHREPGRYGSESQSLLAAFASYAAVAIENTRLYRAAHEQAFISTVMLQVAEATQSLATLGEVLETVVHLAPVMVNVDRCLILLWDENERAFLPAAAFGLAENERPIFDQWRVAPGDEQAFDDLLARKGPIFIYDVATDDRLVEAVVWALGFESLLMLPLLAQGEVLGAMLIDYQGDWIGTDPLETLRDERLAIIQGIAFQAAAAVENAKLREAQQEEAYVSAALLQVAQTAASLNDLDTILSSIVRITPILVGVDRCIIFLWDEEQSHFVPAQSYGIPRQVEQDLAQHYAPGDFPLLDNVLAAGELAVQGAEWEAPPGQGLVPPDVMAALIDPARAAQSVLLAVPLVVKGHVLGVMVLEEASSLPKLRSRRLEIITGIAHQVALAVQNDRLQEEQLRRERLEQELALAREIQRTFIPISLPQLPGWEFAATWRAARQVAGDFYDCFELPGERLGLVIADVADKGMPAALFMAMTRTLMRAAAREYGSPAATLARVNDLLVPDARHGMFVTAIYGVLSLKDGALAYANAGHNLPYWVRSRTQELERFEKGGVALGILEGVRPLERVILLEVGDQVVLYTDGVTEAFAPDGDAYGEKRLQQVLQTVQGYSAQEILEAIERSLLAFIGDNPLSDDLTMLILRRL
ncbi:MAG: GAF domain-containing protein [Anaerolineae bacterium]|nr:GAF domain-containing protein [Anaerolineae bacterium]